MPGMVEVDIFTGFVVTFLSTSMSGHSDDIFPNISSRDSAAIEDGWVLFCSIASIFLGAFPYALLPVFICLVALREKAAYDKTKRRDGALEEAKKTLGALEAAQTQGAM